MRAMRTGQGYGAPSSGTMCARRAGSDSTAAVLALHYHYRRHGIPGADGCETERAPA